MAARRSKKKPAMRRSPKRSSNTRARSGGPGKADKRAAILEHLGADESRLVLLALVARHPDLGSEVADLVEEILGRTSFEYVADGVLEELANLEVFEMSRHSGSNRFGDTDPSEAAAQMVVQAIEPYVQGIESCAAMGLHEAALETCRGVLLGMYRAERGEVSEVLGWIPDGLGDLADIPIDALGTRRRAASRGTRRPVPSGVKQFAKEHLPEWKWLHR